jgi:hypothetical protein
MCTEQLCRETLPSKFFENLTVEGGVGMLILVSQIWWL